MNAKGSAEESEENADANDERDGSSQAILILLLRQMAENVFGTLFAPISRRSAQFDVRCVIRRMYFVAIALPACLADRAELVV